MLSDAPGRAVFLDRDGVINENRDDHVKSWTEFVFLPGAIESIVALSRARCRILVVTNQAVINRGLASRASIDQIHARLCDAVARAGGHIDEVLYCPHRPDEGCGCRKPQPGLLIAAADRYGLDLTRSYMVGDSFGDIAAGRSVGCETILVRTGRGNRQLESSDAARFANYIVADDLQQAARLILGARGWGASPRTVPVPIRVPARR